MILAKLIKDHREKHRLSIRQMAKKIGIRYDALWRFEQGRPIKVHNWVTLIKWVLTT